MIGMHVDTRLHLDMLGTTEPKEIGGSFHLGNSAIQFRCHRLVIFPANMAAAGSQAGTLPCSNPRALFPNWIPPGVALVTWEPWPLLVDHKVVA